MREKEVYIQEGVSDLERLPISSRLIKNLHKTLLGGGVRGGGKTSGEFRTIQNYIGTQGCTLENASYIPPELQLVDIYMSNLEKFINEDDEEQYKKDIAAARKIYSEWIDFFLSACINESSKLIGKIEKINDLYSLTINKSIEIIDSSKMREIIDVIFEFPIFTT